MLLMALCAERKGWWGAGAGITPITMEVSYLFALLNTPHQRENPKGSLIPLYTDDLLACQ